jgi:glucosylceramidase
MKKILRILGVSALFFMQIHCSSSNDDSSGTDPGTPTGPTTPVASDVDFWLTKGDESVKLIKQTTPLAFGTLVNGSPYIDIDASQTFQTIDGFGYTLTGGSAEVINGLNTAKKQELLQDLFSADGIGVSYLRLSIGASDMSDTSFTYDDEATGQTDTDLSDFSMFQDTGLISLLHDILAINPNIKIIATPWSAPVWMKDNGSFTGGSLLPEYYDVYSKYFVKYLQAMQLAGITIDAVTPQNEPLNPNNNPSMVMTADEENTFIKNNLGPAFQTAGLNTKIIVYDHNCDVTNYALSILGDSGTSPFVDGSAWHLYGGTIDALSTVHNAYPSKNVYFTEQYTPTSGSFSGDLNWHLKNVVIGSMRNWSKNALEWNLANNASYGPHTDGGCSVCKGAITVSSSSSYSKNVGYYIIAHASKFVPAGSIRIASNVSGTVNTAAFKTPAGKIVLIAENEGPASSTLNLRYNSKWVTVTIGANDVATFTWAQ